METTLAPGAHRAIRWVDATESALAGELVTDGEQMRVRVPVQDVPSALWEFADADHVVGVRDVVRTADGHDALLPWCAEPIDAFLGRRAMAEQQLSTGEAVTLVGSVLRAISEVAAADVGGTWWLTDDARPVFVPGEGSSCTAGAMQIVVRVRESAADRMLERVLAGISEVGGDHRVVAKSIEQWERELTDLAAPRPLMRQVLAPERATEVMLRRDRPVAVAARPTPTRRARAAEARGGLRAVFARETWAMRLVGVHERLRSMRERTMRRQERVDAVRSRASADRTAAKGGRGRMLLVGVAVAGVVLLGGLLWPSDDGSSASDKPTKQVEAAAQRSATAPAADVPDPETVDAQAPNVNAPDATQQTEAADPPDDSLEREAVRLLEGIRFCVDAGDDVCEAAVADGSGASVLSRIDTVERPVVLVEEYGDVAVLRVSGAEGAAEQMLVLVRQNEQWLVRDVYDVADQPLG